MTAGGKRAGAGRPLGSPNKPKLWADAIRRAVLRQAKGEKTKRLEVLADSLIRAGMAGDVSALREVGDRLDGRPAQAIVGDADADPIQLERIERVIVRPPNRDR